MQPKHVACICPRLIQVKPIFNWKLGSRWLPNANEINTKNMKCTWPTPEFCVGTQRNLYSTGLRLGFASGKTQILGFHRVKCKLEGSRWHQDTNMLVSPTQNSGVGGIALRQPQSQEFCVAVEYRLNSPINLWRGVWCKYQS